MTAAPPVRVLLADDSALLRRLLADAISEVDGVELVAQAADGAQAMAAIRACRPDVVLMDLQMPVVGGLAALRALRQSGERLAGAPFQIIVFSNHADGEYRDACLAEGANYFFDKSAGVERVLGVLRSLAPVAS